MWNEGILNFNSSARVFHSFIVYYAAAADSSTPPLKEHKLKILFIHKMKTHNNIII